MYMLQAREIEDRTPTGVLVTCRFLRTVIYICFTSLAMAKSFTWR